MFRYFFYLSSLIAYDFTPHLEELERDGFTVIPHLFNAAEERQAASCFEKIKEEAFALVNTTQAHIRHFKENNQDHISWYWKGDQELVLQAGKGRYDWFQGFQKGFFGTETVLRNPTLEALMHHLMIDDFTNYAGIIYSDVGSEDQYWHRDTYNLSHTRTDGKELVTLDDFYFTVLIPITVPFTFENGATEFMVGTHKLSASEFAHSPCRQVEVPLGSALVFNGKINHRGKANHSDAPRPALYLVYHKKWYNDRYRRGIADLKSP